MYLWARVFVCVCVRARVYTIKSQHSSRDLMHAAVHRNVQVKGANAKAKLHYRSLSYAWYRCRLSFTLLRLLPSKGGCATTLCTDLPSATFSILALL